MCRLRGDFPQFWQNRGIVGAPILGTEEAESGLKSGFATSNRSETSKNVFYARNNT